jgi:methyl-accepting chemotaxis protein
MLLLVIPLAVIAFVYIAVALITSGMILNDNNLAVSEANENTILASIEDWRTATLGYAEIASDNLPETAVAAINSKAAAEIAGLFAKIFTHTNCDEMIITDTEGTVLTRLADSERFGDNISAWPAVADALNGQYVSYAYLSADTGCAITAGVPVYDGAERQIGVIFLSKRLDQEKTLEELKHASGCDIIIYRETAPLMSTLEADAENMSSEIWLELSAGDSVVISKNGRVDRYIPLRGRDDQVYGALLMMNEPAGDYALIVWIALFCLSIAVLSPIIHIAISRFIKPIRALEANARQLETGDLSLEVEKTRSDEIGDLQNSIKDLVKYMREQSRVIAEISVGNLAVTYTPSSARDSVGNNLVKMIGNNNDMLSKVRQATAEVFSIAEQAAKGSQVLAENSSEQAATIEMFHNLLEEIQSESEQNLELANQTHKDIEKVGELMVSCQKSMTSLVLSMQTINDSSQDITKVIKVIDDIAFQTNILALNAAVEAARAGQHGKGFSVVAEEVRNLAAKSAQAAKETAALIEDSMGKVSEGRRLTNETSGNMQAVAEIAAMNVTSIAKITDLSGRQKSAVAELNNKLNDMLAAIRSIASTAEESAAFAQEMSTQAELLSELVNRYKLKI